MINKIVIEKLSMPTVRYPDTFWQLIVEFDNKEPQIFTHHRLSNMFYKLIEILKDENKELFVM